MGSLPLYFAVTQALYGGDRENTASVGFVSGQNRAVTYIRSMQKLAIILPLLAFLGAALWFAYFVFATDVGPPIPASGYVAMALGILFSLVVGIGLMALVFYSHRHGYDERGHHRAGDRN